jgi:tryptophan 2,3-dioxygenase
MRLPVNTGTKTRNQAVQEEAVVKNDPRAPLTYSEYIGDRKIVEALELPIGAPKGVEAEDWPVRPEGWAPGDDWPNTDKWAHDEVLFIRTHQAFEAWFALVIHELSSVCRDAEAFYRGQAGTAIERIDLAQRQREKKELIDQATRSPIDRSRYPNTFHEVENERALDQRLDPVLQLVLNPGAVHANMEFPPHLGEGDEFETAMNEWAHRLNRAATALRTTIPFFDVLQTMTPASFLTFRERLQPASGFGSAQFREIEYLLGLREALKGREEHIAKSQTPWGQARIARRRNGTSLRDIVYGFLHAAALAASQPAGPEKGLPRMDDQTVDDFVAQSFVALMKDQRRGMIELTQDDIDDNVEPAVRSLSDAIVDGEVLAATFIIGQQPTRRFAAFLESCLQMDRALLQWRDHHIRFVEMMIGNRRGTGGGGVRYLKETVRQQPLYMTHAFPCLWQARSLVRAGEA